jgi:molybdopterin converting factor small subunit
MPTIRIPSVLLALTGGVAEIDVEATTVRDALIELDRKHPGITVRVLDAASSVKPYVRIYVGPEDIGALSGLDTRVGERDEIAIVPAIAGGAGPGSAPPGSRHDA